MVWNYIILSSAHYIDDIPAMLFFVLGLTALESGKRLWFYLVFFVAVINRETAVFLVPAMLILRFKQEKLWKLAVRSVVLIGIAYGLRHLLVFVLDFKPEYSAGMFQNTLKANLIFMGSLFHGDPEALRMLMIFGGLWAVLPFCRKNVPKKAMQLTLILPLFFAGMLYVGNLNNEARIFNEMIPPVTTPCIALFFPPKKQTL